MRQSQLEFGGLVYYKFSVFGGKSQLEFGDIIKKKYSSTNRGGVTKCKWRSIDLYLFTEILYLLINLYII